MAAPLDADQPGAPGDAVGGALGRVVRDKEVVLGVADQGRRKCLQRVGVHVRVGDKCVEGAAELDDRLGSNTVHPAEIGLGLLGELLKGDTPGRGQCLPSWPSQARGLAGPLPGHAVTRPARRATELSR